MASPDGAKDRLALGDGFHVKHETRRASRRLQIACVKRGGGGVAQRCPCRRIERFHFQALLDRRSDTQPLCLSENEPGECQRVGVGAEGGEMMF